MLSLDIQLKRNRFDLNAKLALDAPVTGIFGPSGSGKSTLLNIIAGLCRPQQGWLTLDGETLFDSRRRRWVKPHKRRIGVVFQDSQLFPHYSIRKNLLYGFHRTPRSLRQFRLDEIVDLLEIGHLLDSRPHQLSGGEKQRVGLGRALLASPRLVLLDEPLASLDNALKQQILPFLKRVKDELNLPLIYVSHAIDEILQLTEQLVVIEQGRILGTGSFLDVIKNENILNLASSLGLENVLAVRILAHDVQAGFSLADFHGQRLLLPLSSIPLNQPAYVSVKSSEIALTRKPIADISIQNQLQGTICAITRAADRIMLQIDAGEVLVIEITFNAFRDMALRVGDQVYCLIKTQSFDYLNGNSVLRRPQQNPGANTHVLLETPAANGAHHHEDKQTHALD